MDACRHRLGPTFTVRMAGLPPLVVLSDPAVVKEMLTGDPGVFHAGQANIALKPSSWLDVFGRRSLLLLDGESHAEERKLLMTAFRAPRMRAYAEVMRRCSDLAIDAWPLGRAFMLHARMQRLTLDVLMQTLFGIEPDGNQSALRRAVARMLEHAESSNVLLHVLLGGEFGGWAWLEGGLRLARSASLKRAIDAVNSELRLEIAHRRGLGGDSRDDVLAALLAARSDAGLLLDDELSIDAIRTLLVAGHETTARALTWTVIELLQNPYALARLRRELAHGDEYLDAVIRETLRLHAVVPIVSRQLMSPARIGARDYPAGTILAASIHLAQRDPTAWRDPERFDPDRFIGSNLHAMEYFPFGAGSRRCLGMGFALLQMRTVVRQVARRLDLRLASLFPRVPHAARVVAQI